MHLVEAGSRLKVMVCEVPCVMEAQEQRGRDRRAKVDERKRMMGVEEK